MFTQSWLTRFQERLNVDEEMAVIGDWFTVAMSLSCDEERRIAAVRARPPGADVLSPKLDVPCAFGFRASPRHLAEGT